MSYTISMKTLPFKSSPDVSIGVELEFQIINPNNFDLTSRAKDLIKNIKESSYQKKIKPEITQSMIEINSLIYLYPKIMLAELLDMQLFLSQLAKKIKIHICGGGTHPFDKWSLQKIFPSPRFIKLSKKFQYLSKCSTVFGQHIHIGCKNGEDALYLTHALSQYVPHFIAMSASSPFYQGVDTGFHSTRSTLFNAFPLSGVLPCLTTWDEFSSYFYKLLRLGIIKSMKDFYWDIRPKPEFGTVEIRVCDTPLTIKKSLLLVAYAQTLSRYLLKERPVKVTQDLYHLYHYNRFQASRYGFDGEIISPTRFKKISIMEDILKTIENIKDHTCYLKNSAYISQLSKLVEKKQNDTVLLRQLYNETGSLAHVVEKQCQIWAKKT